MAHLFQRRDKLKAGLFLLMLAPLMSLLWATVFDQLGANPAQALVRASGDWTLRLLCLVLALTPLRFMLRQPALASWRRMTGLFVFFYALLHMLAYSGFDMAFEVSDIAHDLTKRPFILVGFLAFVMLWLLALTSFKRAVLLLGGKNWKRLHTLVYLVALLAIVHFFWMRAAKNDFSDVLFYTCIMALLLGWRLLRWLPVWPEHPLPNRLASEGTTDLVARTRPK